ncbi:hypothetical protein [Pseudomonas prosekii]|uniref:Uncharacterized protein n=1 Tax=Pseudomonas prosekii TaxID=1148509 RepID=A0A1H2B4K4_9PSED|nr:hypothetical protein [Pseudomonas prosekii]SDT52997.1 hypothetical protein SAMN05216222_4910 [Pseudomonas prosekii]
MRINLSPQSRDFGIEVVRSGETLTINGEAFDFSPMADGDTLPAAAIDSIWFAGPVEKRDGELELTLFLPLPTNFSPEQAFPQPLLSVPDGIVIFPAPLPPEVEETVSKEGV